MSSKEPYLDFLQLAEEGCLLGDESNSAWNCLLIKSIGPSLFNHSSSDRKCFLLQEIGGDPETDMFCSLKGLRSHRTTLTVSSFF